MALRNWNPYRNILCVRSDNLGDVLMTQPALRALKHQTAGRKITLLTSHAGAEAARLLPEVDEVLAFDVPWVKTGSRDGCEKLATVVKKLSKYAFDAAVIFTNFSQSSLPTALLCYLGGIQNVLGYARENPYELINHWVPDREPFYPVKHGVVRQLDLVAAVGAQTHDLHLRLPTLPTTRRKVMATLGKFGVNLRRPWVIINPGTSEAKRQYPLNYFVQAAKILIKELRVQIVVSGSKAERRLVGQATAGMGSNAFSAAGIFDTQELVAFVALTDLLISNNTGPAHIAAACGTPVVDLYARTNPEHTPWLALSRVLYFDIPDKLRSRNQTLAFIAPRAPRPMPEPRHVVQAAAELLVHCKTSRLPRELTTW